MALTAAFNGTNITVADTTTDWDNTTITAAEAWTVEVVHQGSACIGFQASSKDGMGLYTYATPLNFNTTYLGQHLFIWVNVTMPGTMEALATGGLYIVVGSDDTNYKKFLVSAKDYKEVMEKGFIRFVLDPSKTATETTGTPDMTAIDTFGMWIDTDEAARIDQLFIDRIDVGWGIEVTGTSTDFWNDLVTEDVGLNAGVRDNMFGIVQKYNDVFFCYGQIKIGDDTGTIATAISDSGKTVKFVSQQYYNGTDWVDMVADDFFKIELVDNATGSTQFTDGILVGSDNGRAGSSISGSLLHDTEVDFETGIVNAASFVKLYATQLLNMRAGILFHDDADSLFYGGVVNKSGQFIPGVAEIRNIVFAETTDLDAAVLWGASIDIEDCSFIANTIGAAMEHPAQGTFTHTSLTYTGNTYDILYSAAASSGLLTINASGSNPTTYEITNTTGNTVSILNSKNFKFTLNPSITGYEWRIYSVTALGSMAGATELDGEETATADNQTYSYNYTSDISVAVQVISQPDSDYVESITYYTLGNTDQDLSILLTKDENN